MKNPWEVITDMCLVCGHEHYCCDGQECKRCRKWTCHKCLRDGICLDCLETVELEDEMEEADSSDPRPWFRKLEAKRESKSMAIEEAGGK